MRSPVATRASPGKWSVAEERAVAVVDDQKPAQAGALAQVDTTGQVDRERSWMRPHSPTRRNFRPPSGPASSWRATSQRPHTLELVNAMATEVVELHGDRLFRDDAAIVGGFCRIDGRRAVFVGHQKGAEVDENIRRNFGMPHPEGYRKAIRLYRLAERLQLPVVTFIDTPGAFPGPASEERGVAEAIAHSIMIMTGLRTPIVTVITGEGGSGGALALAVGDVVLALENSIYSVISPEGAASILWRIAGLLAAGGGGDAPDRGRAARAGRDRRGRARARRRRARASRPDRART